MLCMLIDKFCVRVLATPERRITFIMQSSTQTDGHVDHESLYQPLTAREQTGPRVKLNQLERIERE